MKGVVCRVSIVKRGRLGIAFSAYCRKCDRPLGTFSQHESAMNWAQAHATSSKHIRGNDG